MVSRNPTWLGSMLYYIFLRLAVTLLRHGGHARQIGLRVCGLDLSSRALTGGQVRHVRFMGVSMRIVGWRRLTSVGLASGAALAAAMLAATAAHADDTSPLDLLGDTQIALTDADQALGQIDVSNLTGAEAGVAWFIGLQSSIEDHALSELDKVDSAESAILSFDQGALSNFFNPLFVDLDQQWYQSGEAVLVADQALAGAVASGSFPDMIDAQFGVLTSNVELIGDTIQSFPVDWIGSILGADAAGGSAADLADLGSAGDALGSWSADLASFLF